jgi:hypothetical protein
MTPRKHGGSHPQWSHPALTVHQIRAVAVKAMCDPRCVISYLWGSRQPAIVRARVEHGLVECGHGALVGTIDERLAASANRAALAGPPSSSSPPAPAPLARTNGRPRA